MRKLISGLIAVVASSALGGCGEDLVPPVPIPDECKLECKSAVEAGGSVSGIVEVDAFFTSVVKLNGQVNVLDAEIKAALREMAVAAGAQVTADMSVSDLAAAVNAQVSGGFGGSIEGGLSLSYVPPKCEVSASATLEAAASCDASVDPGSASVECKGECVADASAMASCSGMVQCKGTAPSFNCTGTCEGTCELNAGATCSGTCDGVCELDGTAACDGECSGTTDAGGNCNGECKVRAGGTCSGTCKGSCQLSAGGMCNGKCKGECTYDPGGASCEGKASCQAMGEASVQCKGECKGDVEPPMVKAECQASAKAEANLSADCTPPDIALSYNLAASLQGDANAMARAQFSARLEAFGNAYAELLAKGAKLQLVLDAGTRLLADAQGAVNGAVDGIANGDADIGVRVGALCALDALPGVTMLLTQATTQLQGNVMAVASVTAAIGS